MQRFWQCGLVAVACVFGSGMANDDGAKSDRANWTNWRGADGTRALASGPKVLKFGGERFRWKVDLPGKGSSTPIVVDGRIFLTVPIQGVDGLLCLDADGQQQFQTLFGAEDPGKHRRGSGANASPISDGQNVFVYFKSGTLASVDMRGVIRWQVNLVEKYGRESLYWDHGTSPILTERYVIMARMDERDSWLAAFDKSSGELAWKVARNYETPRECDHGYSTPIVIQYDQQESILTWGAEQITIHRAMDGKLVWSCGNFNAEKNELWPTIASPVVVGEMVVVAYGRADRGTPRLFGIRLDGQGDVTKSNHVWSREDIGAFVPTPLVHGKNVIVLGDRGDVECLDPQTGQTIWKDKYPAARANFYASPLLLGSYLYAIREDGAAFVSEIEGRSVKLLAENEMQQDIVGSPVPFGNSILIRGETHLFCVAPE